MSKLTRMAALCSLAGLLAAGLGELAWSKEIRFTARDVEGDKAVWHADALLLEQEEISGSGELIFVLNNPTATEHAFFMPGVQRITCERTLTPEQSPDVPTAIRIPYVEPLAVTIKPGESKRIRVHAADFLGPKAIGKAFRFFCTIHKDIHQSGSLYAM